MEKSNLLFKIAPMSVEEAENWCLDEPVTTIAIFLKDESRMMDGSIVECGEFDDEIYFLEEEIELEEVGDGVLITSLTDLDMVSSILRSQGFDTKIFNSLDEIIGI